MLLKHGFELTGQANDVVVIEDINNAEDDLHEQEFDNSQDSLFEANDDFILMFLPTLASNVKFSIFFLAYIDYCMPTQTSLLRPPSYRLS
jgi:hypothetical protein